MERGDSAVISLGEAMRMLAVLDSWFSVNTLIWLFPVAFMLHDFEEIIFIEGWYRKHGAAVMARIPVWMQVRFGKIAGMNSSQFAVAVMLEFIAFIPITYAASEKGFFLPFLGCNAVLFLHVFTHLGQSLYLGRYTPGVVTAVLLCLVYPLYLFDRLIREGIITYGEIMYSLPIGLLVIPLVLLGHELGRRVAPER
jgi:hypothetical protein